MKDVIISITGIQYAAHDTDEAVELVTDGKYCFKDGHGKLTYDESELTGMEGTTTSFLISPGEVILSREGTLTSQMVFPLRLHDHGSGHAQHTLHPRREGRGAGNRLHRGFRPRGSRPQPL